MPSLQDVIDELRRLGVLASEVVVPRKIVSKLIEKASDLAEKDEESDED